MKNLLTSLCLFLITGCSVGHYYTLDDDPNHSMKVLYKDNSLWLAIEPMKGSTSSVMFAARTDETNVPITVHSISLSIKADGKNIEPTTSTIAPRAIMVNKKQMQIMHATYNFSEPPESIKANIQLTATSGDKEFAVNETVSLSIVEYGLWGALMGI